MKFKAFIIIIILFNICASFQSANGYQTECVNIGIDSYVTIKIWDVQKGPKYTLQQAQKDAIHSIIFSGISGNNGCIAQPPILNKKEDLENFQNIEKSFFDQKGMWSIFTKGSATETTIPSSIGSKNWKVYQVTVSTKELRKYLEEQKIIKSMSNGF